MRVFGFHACVPICGRDSVLPSKPDVVDLKDEVIPVAIAIQILASLLRLEGQKRHRIAEHPVGNARVAGFESARGHGLPRREKDPIHEVVCVEHRVAYVTVTVEIPASLDCFGSTEGDQRIADNELLRVKRNRDELAALREVHLHDSITEIAVIVQIAALARLRCREDDRGTRDLERRGSLSDASPAAAVDPMHLDDVVIAIAIAVQIQAALV
jgi:hypothetical protein